MVNEKWIRLKCRKADLLLEYLYAGMSPTPIETAKIEREMAEIDEQISQLTE